MRRMRNAQLGVKGTGDHRGLQMATAASVVLDVVLELRKVPELLREGRIELAAKHLTGMLAAPSAARVLRDLGRERPPPAGAREEAAARLGVEIHGEATEAPLSRNDPRGDHRARLCTRQARSDWTRNAPEDEIADTTKALGVQIARYGLHRRFGPRAELARRQR